MTHLILSPQDKVCEAIEEAVIGVNGIEFECVGNDNDWRKYIQSNM